MEAINAMDGVEADDHVAGDFDKLEGVGCPFASCGEREGGRGVFDGAHLGIMVEEEGVVEGAGFFAGCRG